MSVSILLVIDKLQKSLDFSEWLYLRSLFGYLVFSLPCLPNAQQIDREINFLEVLKTVKACPYNIEYF